VVVCVVCRLVGWRGTSGEPREVTTDQLRVGGGQLRCPLRLDGRA
jgi:hypothetical protein